MRDEVLVSGLPDHSAAGIPRYQVGTVQFSRTHYGNVVASLESYFHDRPANNYVCVSNVHTTLECSSDEHLRRIQNGSYLTIADGQAVILYAKFAGAPEVQRVMGPDLMSEVFNSPEARDRRHYFLGGAPGTLQSMERNLRSKFPLLQIAGLHSPPFRKLTSDEDEALRRDILATAPDYLWVCFGAPKQEYWMKENHGRYPGILLIGIGAGFAYHAGELKRAPIWAQKMACEWVWRLMQDPKRLWKRYLKTNPVFIVMFLKRVMIRILLRR